MESFSNLDKIFRDNRQDPMQSYKILQEFYEILILLEKILQYYTQDQIKTCWTLPYPIKSYKIVKDPTGWVWDPTVL